MLNPSIDRSAVRVSTAFSIIGAIQSLRVLNTQIDPDLAKAAVEAISEWVYEPTLLNGEPVAVITEIAVNFALAK